MELVRYFLNAIVLSVMFAAGSLPINSILGYFNSGIIGQAERHKLLVSANEWPVAPVQHPGDDKQVTVQRISHSVQVFQVQLAQPVIFLFRITRNTEQPPAIPELFAWIGPPELRTLFHHTISRQAP